MSFVDKAVANALAQIRLGHERLAALTWIVNTVNRKRRYLGQAEQEASALRAAILDEINDAISNLLAFGVLGSKKAKQEGIKIAVRRFVDEHREIMSLLEINGFPPESYLTSHEDSFRAEVKKLLEKSNRCQIRPPGIGKEDETK